MKVDLVSYTRDAVDLLLRTKNTRLSVEEDDPALWPEEKKLANIAHMLRTNPGSWEFITYVFELTGVSRNMTHQLVRTRTASFAEKSQRVADLSDIELIRPAAFDPQPDPFGTPEAADDRYMANIWAYAAKTARDSYKTLRNAGASEQDARAIVPGAAASSIFIKCDLRTLSNMARTRLCTRTQGEYQEAFRLMRQLVLIRHPWAEDFIQVECVASGRCAFPAVGPTQCPHWIPELDGDETKRVMKARFWASPAVSLDPSLTLKKVI